MGTFVSVYQAMKEYIVKQVKIIMSLSSLCKHVLLQRKQKKVFQRFNISRKNHTVLNGSFMGNVEDRDKTRVIS